GSERGIERRLQMALDLIHPQPPQVDLGTRIDLGRGPAPGLPLHPGRRLFGAEGDEPGHGDLQPEPARLDHRAPIPEFDDLADGARGLDPDPATLDEFELLLSTLGDRSRGPLRLSPGRLFDSPAGPPRR